MARILVGPIRRRVPQASSSIEYPSRAPFMVRNAFPPEGGKHNIVTTGT